MTRMFRGLAQLMAALAASGLGGSAAAQQPSAPNRWIVDWGDHYCSLVREVGAGAASFMLRLTPGSNTVQLAMLPAPRVDVPAIGSRVQIVLRPSGERFTGEVVRLFETRSGRKVIQATGLEGFLQRFAESTGIELSTGRVRLEATYPAAQQAVEAMKTCENDALVQWGIDPAARANLLSLPETLPGRPILTHRDYPEEALRGRQIGEVLVRLTVSPSGAVSNCTVLVSSGWPSLDEVSCRRFRERARYRPAVGADGSPVEANVTTRIRFQMPAG